MQQEKEIKPYMFDQIRIIPDDEKIRFRREIYCSDSAYSLLRRGEYGRHELSVMKQHNIRIASLDENIPLTVVHNAFTKICGYCFNTPCKDCKLYHKTKEKCFENNEYQNMHKLAEDNNRQAFIQAHKNFYTKYNIEPNTKTLKTIRNKHKTKQIKEKQQQ